MSFALSSCSPMAIPETRSISSSDLAHSQNRPPHRGRPEHSCSSRSADVRHPFLGLRLGCSSRLCRKLEHRCLLTFKHVSQAHDLAVWKFQRIMMCVRLVLVDLPEDGHRVIDRTHFPAKNELPNSRTA